MCDEAALAARITVGQTRLSEHEMTITFGRCFSLRACQRSRLAARRSPRKQRYPSINLAKSAVNGLWAA